MPLLDHFHGETELDLPWPMITQSWAIALVHWLHATLPRDRFRAVSEMRLGSEVAADVAEYRLDELPDPHHGPNGAVATLPAPPAVLTVPALFTDDVEIEIRERPPGRPLVGVIELVSPANKDRAAAREAFVAKSVALLRGIGLVVVDVVTERHANLHNELMDVIGGDGSQRMPNTPIYVSGYRPVHRRGSGANEIEIWPYAATVGRPVPAVPLGLRGGPVVVLDLEATYTAAVDAIGL